MLHGMWELESHGNTSEPRGKLWGFRGCLTGEICIQHSSDCTPCPARPWHAHGSLAELQNLSTHTPTLTLPLNHHPS